MSTTLGHGGLPAVGRFDLPRLFEQVARPGFGQSSTAVALARHYVLKTMDGDYVAGRVCAVRMQACRFAEAMGLTPRSINPAEREPEQAGFIVRNTESPRHSAMSCRDSPGWVSASARQVTRICVNGPRPSCPVAAPRGSSTSTA